MPIIICHVNMFSTMQQIEVLPNHDSFYVEMENLPKTLINLCSQYATNEIHIFGQENYLDKLIFNLNALNVLHYGANSPLRIEVNK